MRQDRIFSITIESWHIFPECGENENQTGNTDLPESVFGSDKYSLSSIIISGFWFLFFPKCVGCAASACFPPDTGAVRFLETLDFNSFSVPSTCFLLFDLWSSVSLLFLLVSFQFSERFWITSEFAAPTLLSMKEKKKPQSQTTWTLRKKHLFKISSSVHYSCTFVKAIFEKNWSR